MRTAIVALIIALAACSPEPDQAESLDGSSTGTCSSDTGLELGPDALYTERGPVSAGLTYTSGGDCDCGASDESGCASESSSSGDLYERAPD